MHGYERCGKDFGVDHHQLHARLHAIKRKNEGGVSESCKQEMNAWSSEMKIYNGMKHEAASTRRASFWSYGKRLVVSKILTRHVKAKCWFDNIDA